MKGLPIFWTRMTVELLPMSLYTHTLRVLPIHFGRETVPSGDKVRKVILKAIGKLCVTEPRLRIHEPRLCIPLCIPESRLHVLEPLLNVAEHVKVQVFYSLISSLKTYHRTLHLPPGKHIAISVLPGTHFHLSQVKHLRVK